MCIRDRSTFQNNVHLLDSDELRLGDSNDLTISHSSFGRIVSTGVLTISVDDDINLDIGADTGDTVNIRGGSGSNETLAVFAVNGSVDLYYDNSKKFETSNTGVTVTGALTATSFVGALTGNVTGNADTATNASGLTGTPNISCGTGAFSGVVTLQNNLDLQDDDKILLGTGDDIEIFHNGTSGQITNSDGSFFIGADRLKLTNGAVSEVFVDCIANGRVDLFYDASVKLTTKSDGVDITGELQCDSLDVDGAGDITGNLTLGGNLDMQDDDQILIGTNNDLRIYHNGNYSFIDQLGTGSLYIRNRLTDQDLILQADNGSGSPVNYIRCDGSHGEVQLFHYGTEKLNTKSDGVDIAGELQCDSLDVDGNSVFTGDIDFVGASYGAVWDTSANKLKFNDNAYISLGTGSDASLYSNGSHAYFDLQSGIGNFYIRDGSTTRFTFDDAGDFTASSTVSDTSGNLRITPILGKSSDYTLVVTDTGKTIVRTGGNITVPSSMTAGMIVTIINNANSTTTITAGATLTFTDSTTGNRTLAAYGVATVTYISASSAYITGTGLS